MLKRTNFSNSSSSEESFNDSNIFQVQAKQSCVENPACVDSTGLESDILDSERLDPSQYVNTELNCIDSNDNFLVENFENQNDSTSEAFERCNISMIIEQQTLFSGLNFEEDLRKWNNIFNT